MSVEMWWTIIGTQIATWVTLLLFVNNRLDGQSRELRRELREGTDVVSERIDALSGRVDAQGHDLSERIDAQGHDLSERIDAQGRELRSEFREALQVQGRTIAARIDALTSRFDAHLERHAS